MLVQKEVGFVGKFCCGGGGGDMYMRDGIHLSGKGQQYLWMNSQQQ